MIMMTSNPHLSPNLITLGNYLIGEFSNQKQALEQPAWFVNLHLWFRPVSLFSEDSLTLFTEQVAVVNSSQPYRPRLLRLSQDSSSGDLTVTYYKFKDMSAFLGGGRDPKKLENLTINDVDLLTHKGCYLKVKITQMNPNSYHFKAFPLTDEPCCFTHQNQEYKIALGFEVTEREYKSHEKGINSQTGTATWGLMGAYCFDKINQF